MIPIGLLGGSFNPAHPGHRAISLHAARVLGLQEVWWLVSPGNPLKADAPDMAALVARAASARRAARRAPIRVTAIERELYTRYTVDTLRALVARYPHRRFVWLMGADNLDQFHRWRDWRGIARIVPIAVINRPGHDTRLPARRAMAWLRRFARRQALARHWSRWPVPGIVLLRLPPDPRSATAVRASAPDWHRARPIPHSGGPHIRDMVTHRIIC